MARVFTEDFEGGTNGANVTTGNTGFDYVGATVPAFTDTAQVGTLAMLAAVTTSNNKYGRIQLAATPTVAIRIYMQRTTSATTMEIVKILNDTTTLALMRWYASGNVGMVLNGALHGTAHGAVPINTWIRMEWLLTATTMQMRLFVGGNIHGTTPDFETAEMAWSPAAQINRVDVGIVSSVANSGVIMDDVALDNATWVGPWADPSSDTPHWFYDDGTAWVDVTGEVHYDNGTAWVPV